MEHEARYKIVATGRRSGKTTLGIYRQVWLMEHPDMLLWWVAPTNQAAFLAWERFKMAYAGDPTVKVSETRKRLVLPNGSQLWCKSAEEPDNLRGEGVDDLTIDEAAHVRRLDYVWRGVLRPMLIDSQGTMCALSTPRRRNEFYRWFVRGQDPQQPDWQSWSFPTTANPFLPPAELDALLQEYPKGSELYRQEILGEFLAGQGAVFRKIRAAVVPSGPEAEPLAGHTYAGGIDWGKSGDFTVSVVLNATLGHMVAMDRFNVVDYVVQRDRIKAQWAYWGVERGLAETNAMGEPNLEMLQRDGLPVRGFQTTARSKRPLIERLAQALELGEIGLLDEPVLLAELEAYERHVSATTGAATYRAPAGLHDDTVMALALAWWAVVGSPPVQTAPNPFYG